MLGQLRIMPSTCYHILPQNGSPKEVVINLSKNESSDYDDISWLQAKAPFTFEFIQTYTRVLSIQTDPCQSQWGYEKLFIWARRLT